MEFGKLKDGTVVHKHVLVNEGGSSAAIMTYGATLIELKVPDRAGHFGDVVLGFDDLASYEKGHPFFGSTVGRYANRIAKGRFTLDGKTYELATNNGPNHLHGGLKGFDKKVWKAEKLENPVGPSVRFTTTSADGEEGYPGNMEIAVTYTLTNDNALRIEYRATTDKATPVNLTNHSYFNLAEKGHVRDHVVTFAADRFTPSDETLIPTGEIKAVEGTPFDFRKPTPIGKRIAELPATGGYDHNLIVRRLGAAGRLAKFATVYDPASGRVLEASTTEPGFQFYTANFLDGSMKGKGGVPYAKHGAFCVEAQRYPDSPNKPDFPSSILRPGQTYRQTTVYKFSTRK
jgi:aldose 1-epimerase